MTEAQGPYSRLLGSIVVSVFEEAQTVAGSGPWGSSWGYCQTDAWSHGRASAAPLPAALSYSERALLSYLSFTFGFSACPSRRSCCFAPP